MNHNIERQDRIDRYIREEMTRDEAQAFEQELATDEALQQEYEESLMLADTIQEIGEDRMYKEALLAASEEDIKVLMQEKRSGKRFLVYAACAAAAILLAVLVGKVVELPTPGSPEGLYYAYYESYPLEQELISRGGEQDSSLQTLLREAFRSYERKNYQQALNRFQSVAEKKVLSPAAFYTGMCLLELNRPAEAVVYLQSQIDLGDSDPFYQPACWYLALTYLELNEPINARPLLQRIIKEGGFYAEKSSAILDKMK